jgi:hypothetical protein
MTSSLTNAICATSFILPGLLPPNPNASLARQELSALASHPAIADDVYSLGVILVIFDPSRPIPPIRPFWLKTKA